MGSAGHAFVAHTKALSPPAQVKDGGYGPPPHPLTVRPGQRYWPRHGKRKLPFVVRRVDGDRVIGVREGKQTVRLSRERLLATSENGSGSFYQFHGYASRRYATFAYIWEIDADEAVLCLPEWHPRRPAYLFPHLVPEQARRPGAWLSLRCDLSAPSSARLEPSDLAPCEEPDPALIHRPDLIFDPRPPTPNERRRERAARR